MSLLLWVVLVYRATEFTEFVARHGMRQQVGFFLVGRGRDLAELDICHQVQQEALATVSAAIPLDWRRTVAERNDLDWFGFGLEDVVIVVGQDGLVVNVAKYFDGQPVIGVDLEPGRNFGVLVLYESAAIADLLRSDLFVAVELWTMVAVGIDDGQRFFALNEVYVGYWIYQSVRYRLFLFDALEECQSSSGLLVGMGIGSTGWCRSAWQEWHSLLALSTAIELILSWFVREVWLLLVIGIFCIEGLLEVDQYFIVIAEFDLVVFGDGIESDIFVISWGQCFDFIIAEFCFHLIR